MAEYDFIITCIPKIWQSITSCYMAEYYFLVSHRYGRVLLCYNIYSKDMAEYYFIITCIPNIWQSITLL